MKYRVTFEVDIIGPGPSFVKRVIGRLVKTMEHFNGVKVTGARITDVEKESGS